MMKGTTMARIDDSNTVYQSGQTVPVTAWYEAVGSRQKARQFEKGATFPNFDGRAICWHLAGIDQPCIDAASRVTNGSTVSTSTQPHV
jgi:hypothetical protein